MTTISHSEHELGGFSANVLLRLLVIFAFAGIVGVMWFYLPLHPEQSLLVELDVRLSELRNAADNYYHQHRHRYPGEINPVNGVSRFYQGQENDAAAAFISQLTQYSDAAGRTSPVKTAHFNLGPYLAGRELPGNPLLHGHSARQIEIDFTLDRPDAIYEADGRSGWRYYLKTGRLVANDDADLESGVQTANR